MKTRQLSSFLFLSLNYFISEMKKITIFYSILLILNLISIVCFQSLSGFISAIFIIISYIFCRFDIRKYHIGILNKSTRRVDILDTFIPTSCSTFRKAFLVNRYCEVFITLRRSDWAKVKAGMPTNINEVDFPLDLEAILIFSPINFSKRIYSNFLGRPDFLKEIEGKIFIHDSSKKSKKNITNSPRDNYIGRYYPLGIKNQNVFYSVYCNPLINPSSFTEGVDKFVEYIEKRIKSREFNYEFNYIRNKYYKSKKV